MENVLLDRSSGSFEYPKRGVYGGRPARPHGAYGSSRTCPQYHHFQKSGAWNSAPAPALPYAYPRPPIYSSPSLPLLPSNQPPLLPLPPTATKYATFSYPPPPTPPRAVRPAAPTAVAPAAASRQLSQRDRRRRPVKPPAAEPAREQKKKKPLERATPLPPAPAVTEALDDLEQELARSCLQDLLHALAPPPSSLPLPRFSLVVKASPHSATAGKVVPAAPSCNAEAATADGLRRLLRL
ncbi:hypothetical protein CFC21_058257 [Triticum aestivum]|uniref:Uncharacterized protein n=4 Tax=Triticum TaxID=4564 RepID=A0A9R0WDJ4_TRITD|nr:vegetative cell wall protein gp1-like [Triticum aestivum]KAF7049775.1 hypothetical protein CFC21_058257 [Triticum aestivum]VAI07817.1 unnamed protein product [Triticum turgidum subsp. durum]